MSGNVFFEAMERVCSTLHKDAVYYLHKQGLYDAPDNQKAYSIPDNEYFNKSDTERIDHLSNILPLCYGWHNGRIVLSYNGYFVGFSIESLVDKFTVSKTTKKGEVIHTLLSNEAKRKLCADLIKFTDASSHCISVTVGLETDLIPKYVGFNCVNDVECNPIVNMIAAYYDRDLQGMDIRTNTPLSASYFMMIGWLFSSVDKKRRIAGCFECPTSGVGKTGFIRALCNRVDVVHSSISQTNGSANQFSFSSAMAVGPDIVCVDDPSNGTEDILCYVSNLVTNKQGVIELKGKDRYTMDDLDCKVIITSNKTLYYKGDQCNFMTTKLFVLKTNELLQDNGRASEIIAYISHCKKEDVEQFISYCVKLFDRDGDEWIAKHLGGFVDEEEKSNLIEDVVNYDKIKHAIIGKTTLIDCLNNDIERNGNRDHDDNIMKLWNKLTKFIQTQWSDIARQSVASVTLNNCIYAVGNRPSKSRYKNYTITKELQEMLLKYLHDDSLPSYHATDDCVF